MYLSKLKIFGFKSFAQKVEINFPGDGITSVVGPNGCGKSNIVDGIRWVLGEQRAKQLRSTKMEDVIFSGTAERPPMNIAEVSLVINNDRGVLPSGFSEIQITRRAHRSGESEYLINNQECRLKDIHNLFYDTGMGAASYSLMESRMIDSVLSDKADERRALFEETAGISKYKQQRKETLRHLERVSQDLARVDDNLQMALKNVSHFERQAKKAEEWKSVSKRIKDLELSINFDNYAELKSGFVALIDKKAESVDLGESSKTKLTLLESQLVEAKLNMAQEEQDFREAEQLVLNRTLDINNLNSEVQRIQDKVRHVEESLDRYQEDINNSQSKLDDLGGEKSQNHEEIAEATLEISGAQSKLETLEEHKFEIKNRYEDVRQQSIAGSSQRLEVVQNFNDAQNKLNRLEQEIEAIVQEESKGQVEIETLSSEISRVQEEIVESNVSLQELNLDPKIEALNVKSNWLETARAKLQELEIQEREIFEKALANKSRVDVLEQLEKSNYDSGPLYTLLSENSAGSLLDNINPHKFPNEVEFCLGEKAKLVLSSSDAFFQSSLDSLLHTKNGGKAWLSKASELGAVDSPRLAGEGLLCCLADDVQAEGNWKFLSTSFLHNYYVCDSLQTAQDFSQRQNGDYWFLSPEGVLFHTSGACLAGSENIETGTLARRKELESLLSQREGIKTNLESKREDLKHLRQEISECEVWIKAERYTIQSSEKDYQQKKQSLLVAETRLENFQDRKKSLLANLSGAKEKVAPLASQLTMFQKELLEWESKRDKAETEYANLLEVLEEVETQKSSFEEEYQEARQLLTEKQSSVLTFQQKLEYMDQQEFDLKQLVEKRKLEISESANLIEGSVDARKQLYDKIELENERLLAEEDKRDYAKEAYDVKMSLLEDISSQIKEVNTSIHASTENIHKCEMRLEGVRNKMDYIRERMFEIYEVDVAEDDFTQVEYQDDLVQSELSELKLKIKKLGNINPGAFEDYEAEKSRLEEVKTQFDDLDKARLSLEKTIRKLDKIARERFLETLEQIKTNFQDVFASLMKNGEAKLTLEDGIDPLEAKIEINARPTGKKMRGVTLLSGGERALTATALLFALYLVKPSPYCILDEVDGPLDDANIGRFVDLLRRFSRQTQFIVVTHNKRTMAASDRLYGVTQEIKGISKIASVHLDEATAMVN
jgi:chromosome segregation protein